LLAIILISPVTILVERGLRDDDKMKILEEFK
jgi:hypothetical protein